MIHNAQLDSSDQNPMRVLYDGKIFDRQKAGGINRYFEKLIDHLPEFVEPSMTLTRYPSQNFPQNEKLQRHIFNFAMPRPFRRISRSIQALHFESVRKAIQPDLLHMTYYDTLGGCENITDGTPLVLTVHDMIHELFPDLLDRRGKHAMMKKRAIDRADAIVCVSHKTRADLLDRFPECESRTAVVYHATDLGEIEPEDWQPERPYFLYVGSRISYKNFDGLLDAFQKVVARKPDVQLRLVGPEFSRPEIARIGSLGLEGHILNHGVVDDYRLSCMYRKSVAFVYPSLYEGFGLPLLEAMSCETPVIASNTSSIPEVASDAALLFDPHSKTDLTEAILFLLDNPSLRQQMIQEGKNRCKFFSWKKSAAQTCDVYKFAAGADRAERFAYRQVYSARQPQGENWTQPEQNLPQELF